MVFLKGTSGNLWLSKTCFSRIERLRLYNQKSLNNQNSQIDNTAVSHLPKTINSTPLSFLVSITTSLGKNGSLFFGLPVFICKRNIMQENVDDRDTDADFEGQSKVTGNSLPGQSSQKERGRSHSLPYSKPNSRPNTLPRRSTNESLTPGRRRRTLVYLDSGNTSPSLVSFTTPDRRALDQLIDEADLRNLEDEVNLYPPSPF